MLYQKKQVVEKKILSQMWIILVRKTVCPLTIKFEFPFYVDYSSLKYDIVKRRKTNIVIHNLIF